MSYNFDDEIPKSVLSKMWDELRSFDAKDDYERTTEGNTKPDFVDVQGAGVAFNPSAVADDVVRGITVENARDLHELKKAVQVWQQNVEARLTTAAVHAQVFRDEVLKLHNRLRIVESKLGSRNGSADVMKGKELKEKELLLRQDGTKVFERARRLNDPRGFAHFGKFLGVRPYGPRREGMFHSGPHMEIESNAPGNGGPSTIIVYQEDIEKLFGVIAAFMEHAHVEEESVAPDSKPAGAVSENVEVSKST